MTPAFLSHQLMDQTNEYICYLSAKRMFAFETIETSLDCKCLFESTIAARVDIGEKLPIFIGMLNLATLQHGLVYVGILITGT